MVGMKSAAVGVMAAAVMVCGAGVAQAQPQTVEELAFIMALDDEGIGYNTEESAINVGYAVCEGLRAGMPVEDIVASGVVNGGYTVAESSYILGASIGAFCDEFEYLTGSGQPQPIGGKRLL